MAHLLIIELPGGNDTDVLAAALAGGHQYTFITSDLALYREQAEVWLCLAGLRQCIEVPGFAPAAVEAQVLAVHARTPIDAVLCLIDIRLVDAARLARRLGVRHLGVDEALLLRDKVRVRQRLAERGIPQPEFALADSNVAVREAVERLGLPVLIKPADGYGSQNIIVLRESGDLDPLLTPVDSLLPSRADYGLGVRANDRLLVERYLSGTFIGVDTFSAGGRHTVVAVHDKCMFAPPSFAMRGSTCIANSRAHPVLPLIQDYVRTLLDAVGFDCGATHIEMMLTEQGPRLVEINPRLVGAKIARLASLTLGRSLHADLVNVHLGLAAPPLPETAPTVGVIRWIVAAQAGVLQAVHLPAWTDERVRCVEILKRPGERVAPPFENADRIGYVMVCGENRQATEALADRYVADCKVELSAALAPALPLEAVPC